MKKADSNKEDAIIQAAFISRRGVVLAAFIAVLGGVWLHFYQNQGNASSTNAESVHVSGEENIIAKGNEVTINVGLPSDLKSENREPVREPVREQSTTRSGSLIRLDNGTIQDFSSALIWIDRIEGVMSWYDAQRYVRKVNKEGRLGHRDWRLPNAGELMNLRVTLQLEQGVVSHIDQWYWSGSEWGLDIAISVYLGKNPPVGVEGALAQKEEDKATAYSVRLVRSTS